MDILYPPRPQSKIPPSDLPYYENMEKYVIQPKYNGTRNLIHIYPNRDIVLLSRHGCLHKQYTLPQFVRDQILSLNLETGKEYWLDGELLHNKTPNLKDTIVLFDVLQAGKYLFGVHQVDRLNLLNEICREPQSYESIGRGLQVSHNIWMAPIFNHAFKERFLHFAKFDELEGLVLRNLDSRLDNFGKKEYQVSWLIRCRKSAKGFSF